MVACCPVQVVRCPDRKPAVAHTHRGWWNSEMYNDDEIANDRGEDLPHRVWRLLADPQQEDGGWKWYESEAAALEALSAALILMAKGENREPV